MRWVSLLFGLIMFVLSSVFRFMHYKPENRGTYVDNKKFLFCEVVKMCNGLHLCVPLVEMIKKHIWNVQFGGPEERVMPPRKYLSELPVLPVRTSGPRPELLVIGRGRHSLA
jgi:hypothetical protein